MREIVQEYRKKNEENLSLYYFDATGESPEILDKILVSGSLFHSKKMIVAKNVLDSGADADKLLEIVAKYKGEKNSTILMWSEGTDKNKIDKIKKIADRSQEFRPLAGVKLREWLKEEAKKRGLNLFPAHWARLDLLGNDLWALENELDKFVVADDMAVKGEEYSSKNVFDLGDSFFISKKTGLRVLSELLEKGEDDFNLFAYLVNHNRRLLMAKDCVSKGVALSPAYGLHPFVVKKTCSLAKSISLNHLLSGYNRFLEEDVKIKTGLTRPKNSLMEMLLG